LALQPFFEGSPTGEAYYIYDYQKVARIIIDHGDFARLLQPSVGWLLQLQAIDRCGLTKKGVHDGTPYGYYLA
jgi:hypothetical protein